MPNPVYISRKQLLSGEFSVTVEIFGGAPTGVDTITIPAGFYFNDAASASESLRDALETALNGHANIGARTFTVTWSTTTGRFTIALDVNTFDLDFTGQVDFRDWLGFTTTVSGAAASFTSDQTAQGCIFAGSGRSNFTDTLYEKSGGTTVAESGVVARIGASDTRRFYSWTHEFEPLTEVASPLASGTRDNAGTVVQWTWQDFWEHHSDTGEPFDFLLTAGTAVSTVEERYVFDRETYATFEPERVIPAADTFWRIKLGLRRRVEAT